MEHEPQALRAAASTAVPQVRAGRSDTTTRITLSDPAPADAADAADAAEACAGAAQPRVSARRHTMMPSTPPDSGRKGRRSASLDQPSRLDSKSTRMTPEQDRSLRQCAVQIKRLLLRYTADDAPAQQDICSTPTLLDLVQRGDGLVPEIRRLYGNVHNIVQKLERNDYARLRREAKTVAHKYKDAVAVQETVHANDTGIVGLVKGAWSVSGKFKHVMETIEDAVNQGRNRKSALILDTVPIKKFYRVLEKMYMHDPRDIEKYGKAECICDMVRCMFKCPSLS